MARAGRFFVNRRGPKLTRSAEGVDPFGPLLTPHIVVVRTPGRRCSGTLPPAIVLASGEMLVYDINLARRVRA